MAKIQPFYVKNDEKKIVTVYKYIKPTEADIEMLSIYIRSGFTVREINKKRKTSGKEKLTKASIIKALEGNEEAKKQFNKLLETEGFFTAKSWYLNEYNK
jgi:hypothetical protein